ncbi:MAG: VIT1/CCC1 transporter family protein [Alphaproteobacteria bacterium]|nr:VIT1/CCC1 transporter family protein [Alphaproteobacteria bacterium]
MKNNYNCRAAIILGMHDAIVSLTGLIAGLFFAFTDSKIIIISCIISSITASLSMGAANYLAVKIINKNQALQSAFFTFISYMTTCILLILPFFIFTNRSVILTTIVLTAIFIIFVFNKFCYCGKNFYKHFIEMFCICTTVSIVAFFIGEIANQIFGI